MRSTWPISFFVPFRRYPDCMITRAADLKGGEAKTLAAGYFGRDWSVDGGEFAFASGE